MVFREKVKIRLLLCVHHIEACPVGRQGNGLDPR